MSRSWRGELEAGAQRVQRLQNLEPPLGLRGHGLRFGRQGEQRIGARSWTARRGRATGRAAARPNMSARCTISVLAVGNVEAGLDDRGREQDVVLAVVERRHDVFERGRGGIWPCATRDLHLGHVLVEEILDLGEVLDARHDIERLAAPIALAQQRLAHDQRIERRDEGAHREAVDRRRRDDRELAHAGQRELQRARDRRRATASAHAPRRAAAFSFSLCADAEMLLLVDDQRGRDP